MDERNETYLAENYYLRNKRQPRNQRQRSSSVREESELFEAWDVRSEDSTASRPYLSAFEISAFTIAILMTIALQYQDNSHEIQILG